MSSQLTMADKMELADAAARVSCLASEAICHIYHCSETLVIEKKEDSSPVTLADKHAHQLIHDSLVALTPRWPILSEEEQIPAFSVRSQWSCYWLVDPLDGTKEFIERTGEFTINIALIEHGRPVLGVVYVPLEQRAYVGVVGQGAWIESASGQVVIKASERCENDSVRVLTSRRHKGPALEGCLDRLQRHFKSVERIQAGSALKFCRLAEGKGDIYPRFWPCCEWDTGAGQALLEASGGQLLDTTFTSLTYNQSESLIRPHFYALGALNVDWPALLVD